MPRKSAARRRPALSNAPSRPWSAQDVRQLRQLAGTSPRVQIARTLRRSPAAVTFKAFKLRLSLRVRRGSRRGVDAPKSVARKATSGKRRVTALRRKG